MHSFAIASIITAAASVASAAPTIKETRAAYYVCSNNGFKGDCSVDPCAISWCPDYKPYTYEKLTVEPTVPPVVTPSTTSNPQWYVCANNGFHGSCTVDPCAISWCPDYKPYTYEPISVLKRDSDPTVCAPGTGYFQSCSNGFRGCCKADACGSSWCPDSAPVPAPAVKRADPTVCSAGTGYYQVCANGFKGCCKSDACGSSWCPDYKYGTFEPVGASTSTPDLAPAPVTPPVVTVPATNGGDQTVCPAGTGYYQVCASGFKGCCKTDACSKGYCSA